MRRGIVDATAAAALLDPANPPEPCDHFPDLQKALRRLQTACEQSEMIAICGDYDADGMTSTALLMNTFKALGGLPIAAIPSRMSEGYGLNQSMVSRLDEQGVGLIVTVDNGVAAKEALKLAEELSIEVILTDHHTLPDPIPDVLALLHPATTPENSPYQTLAGVGLAYVLAIKLANKMKRDDAIGPARDLFCIGTVADMAPLTGANRTWLRDGLNHLHQTQCEGLRALQQLAGLGDRPLNSQDIGFKLAPRINAVGRLGDPKLVVDLLTANNSADAIDFARQCEELNRQRRDLCDAIEAEAIALVEANNSNPAPFLLLAQGHWHHGVIGIVATRLMERYHRPTALLAGEGDGRLRASVRAPEGFAVDEALQQCADQLERFGGHPAAGGFTVRAENVASLHEKLNILASNWQAKVGQATPIAPEVMLNLDEIDWDLWDGLEQLEPFGIGNKPPLFWSRNCEVVEQRRLRGDHLQLVLQQRQCQRRAIAWRWKSNAPLPNHIDVAFRINVNRWQGEKRLQLEVLALREHRSEIELKRQGKTYRCSNKKEGELVLTNNLGDSLKAKLSEEGILNCSDTRSKHPYVESLIQEASLALGLRR
ncbi:MAG: single-stranded-DNA-specific exonuclease RecJ [Prochlorococcus sp.]|nr:single-stranded-DNA-specific exonuclease RecJ [Prochlorococcus sp.]